MQRGHSLQVVGHQHNNRTPPFLFNLKETHKLYASQVAKHSPCSFGPGDQSDVLGDE